MDDKMLPANDCGVTHSDVTRTVPVWDESCFILPKETTPLYPDFGPLDVWMPTMRASCNHSATQGWTPTR